MVKLAIVSPNKYKYSETFIHAHVQELPFEKVLLHGGYMPLHASKGLEEPDVLLESRTWHRPHRPEESLQRYLRKENIEVVLAEYGPTGVAVMGSCQTLNLPLIVHFHGYDAYREDILEEQGLHYTELFRQAQALVVVSKDMEAQLIRLGASPEKIHLIPYGVDTGLFIQADPSENPPHLIAVGRFVAKKAPLLTLEAFGQIANQFPEAELTMVGEGELLDDCKAYVAEQEWGDRVHFPGTLLPEEVAERMQQSRALVQHSRQTKEGDSEGLPLSVLEAMATGLPVVSTTHAGIPDAVRHGEEGWLSPEQDVDQMALHMAKILGDPDLAAEMGRAGRERVEKYYTKEIYLGTLTDLIGRMGQAGFPKK